MPIRNTHRVGSYLMTDDETDQEHYIEDMLQLWDGTWRHKKNFETRHPQEFVYARTDPKALRHIRTQTKAAAPTAQKGCIGETTVIRSMAPASHFCVSGGCQGRGLTEPKTVLYLIHYLNNGVSYVGKRHRFLALPNPKALISATLRTPYPCDINYSSNPEVFTKITEDF